MAQPSLGIVQINYALVGAVQLDENQDMRTGVSKHPTEPQTERGGHQSQQAFQDFTFYTTHQP